MRPGNHVCQLEVMKCCLWKAHPSADQTLSIAFYISQYSRLRSRRRRRRCCCCCCLRNCMLHDFSFGMTKEGSRYDHLFLVFRITLTFSVRTILGLSHCSTMQPGQQSNEPFLNLWEVHRGLDIGVTACDVCVCMYVRIYVCMCVCIYVCVCICIYVCVCVCAYTLWTYYVRTYVLIKGFSLTTESLIVILPLLFCV